MKQVLTYFNPTSLKVDFLNSKAPTSLGAKLSTIHFLLIRLSICVLVSLFCTKVSSLPNDNFNLIIEHWDLRDGLPTWKINSFFEDSRGVLWMATQEGAMSFDGYKFKQYSPFTHNANFFSTDRIIEDVHHNIWLIGVQSQGVVIDVLNPLTEEIVSLEEYLNISVPFDSLSIYNIRCLNQVIWLFGKNEKIYQYDGTWKVTGTVPKHSINTLFFPHRAEEYFMFDMNTQHLQPLGIQGQIKKTFLLDSLQNVLPYMDSEANLWLGNIQNQDPNIVKFTKIEGTQQKTYTLLELPTQSWNGENLQIQNKISSFFSHNNLIFTRTNDNVYIGNKVNPALFKLSDYFKKDNFLGARYFLDSSGSFWFASEEGLFNVSIQKNNFLSYLTNQYNSHSIRGITQFDSLIYVNTYNGMFTIDDENGKTQPLSYFSSRHCLATITHQDAIYTSSHSNHVNILTKNKEVKSLEWDGQGGYAFLEGFNSTLLFGTTKGLYHIYPVTETIKSTLFKDIIVYCLYRNNEGIWAGTPKGLYLLRENGEVIDSFLMPSPELPYREVRYIYQAEDGLFWIAARGLGLIRWNRATGEYRVFTPKNGLSHHTIHAIYEDRLGYLWMPSDQGLMRFNVKNYNTRTFYTQDGLPSDEFNYLSHFQAEDGTFYFGTVDGLVSFHPDKLRNTSYEQPRLCLTAVGNFDEIKGNYTNELQDAINNKTIVLKPNQKFITLEISALIYKELPNVEYGWMLDNRKSEDWVVQKENIIRLNNLSYGEHQIKVKVRIVGNQWSSDTIDLKLIVKKPIYTSIG